MIRLEKLAQHADIYLLAQQIADNAAVLPHAEAEQLADQFVAFDRRRQLTNRPNCG